MPVCTIGWTDKLDVDAIDLAEAAHDFILRPDVDVGKLSIEDLFSHIDAIRPDAVIVDGDVFHEIFEHIQALELCLKREKSRNC